MVHIISNGSKWVGEAPDSIERLVEVLGREPLNPTFEGCGNFIIQESADPLRVRFFGNFANLAHVFSIRTDEPAVIAALTKAVRENQASPDYQRIRAGYHPCAQCGRLAQFCRCPPHD
jgi:hypothetical protein